MVRMTRNFTIMLVAACVGASAASAQTPDSTLSSSTDSTAQSTTRAHAPSPLADPRLATTAVAMRHLNQLPDPLAFQRPQPMSVGKPKAMMIVGGAAIVLGAVIGGDVGTLFMIGGSASVLVGLYQYLK